MHGQLLQDVDDGDEDEEEDDINVVGVEQNTDDTIAPRRNNDDEDEGTIEDDVGNAVASDGRSTKKTMDNVTKTTEAGAQRFSFHFRDVEDLLEKYSGDESPSVQRWTSDFEDMAALYKWSELEKITFSIRLLHGSAKRFVNYDKCGTSWPKLKKRLMEKFGEVVNSKKVHRELSRRKIKPGESYQDYIYVMLEIAGQCLIEQRAVFQYIIEGIPDEPEKKSILYGARTVRELKDKFMEYNSMKKERENKNKAKEREGRTDEHSIKDQRKRSLAKGGNPIKRCFNCGDQDHLSANCPSNEKGVKYFKCNEYGHIATKCTKQRDSCVVSYANTQKCQTEVVIVGKKFAELIDTGSDISLIRSDEYEKLNAPTLRERRLTFEGLGARKKQDSWRITNNNFN